MTQLMDELVRIKQAVEVDETLLVVDAMAGQEAVNVAKTFNEKVGISGVILTKTRRRHPRRRGAFGAGRDRYAHLVSRVPAKSSRILSRSTRHAWQTASLAWETCFP